MAVDKNLKRPYLIETYNPKWVFEFEKIKEEVVSVFKYKALEVEHVGSTSVPGMNAKHCIDVLVVVDKIEPFILEKEKMENLGYKWEDDYINPKTITFWKESVNKQKNTNIHFCEKGSFDEDQFIIGRDYLRENPERVLMYNDLKEELSHKFPDDYPAYRAGKQDFLKETKRLALIWRKNI